MMEIRGFGMEVWGFWIFRGWGEGLRGSRCRDGEGRRGEVKVSEEGWGRDG